ncbi:FmdB family zinc ribbon protein [Simplicispira hankyongi]|uniref:Zinc ribbon domain-containing protein n=1 Tax=Simplicispira hankyongi TaxID=2315688 RepID=A0A398CBX1_9BURK|nr:FmdB family zinc ribbon protein [Simplicispira hankyongi]MBU6465304.1 zinc ribbon domain-containing protein [Burkholderiales bacterium]RID98428.1 zinc ribbon domain-containing protein [Simplicispira hankyongi]
MPIYAYKCSACGHARDVLQKMSDPLLTVCPQCGAETFTKQVTAAGFQLKGSGWYATDFRGGAAPASAVGTSADKPAGGSADAGAAAPVPAPTASPAPAASASSTKAD